ENSCINFVSGLTTTIRKLGLYPSNHPTVVYSIKNLYLALQKLLRIKDTISISLSSDNQIFIEGYPVGQKGSKPIEGLGVYFRKLDIENLSFNSGISDKELDAFIRILLMDQDEIKKVADLNKLFSERNIEHIKIAQFSYIKIQKGKKVVELTQEKQQFLDKIKSRIKDYSLGKIEGGAAIQDLENDLINAVTAEFKEGKKLKSTTKILLKKFLSGSQNKEGVQSRLSRSLLDSGCLPEVADGLVNSLSSKVSRKTAVNLGEITREEYRKVKSEAEELRLKISQLEKEIDSRAMGTEALKKENKKVTQEKERVNNIVRHMADGLVVVDPQGNIVMLNPAAEKLLGIGKQDIGMPLNNAVKDEHLLTLVKSIAPDKDGTVHKDVELLSRDDSTRRVLRTSSAVVEDPDGKTVGMVAVLNDITRQKEIEKMKSNFVANVSHELRTPLGAIQQNISLLIEGLPGALTQDQKKFLNITQDQIKRLKRLIYNLLDSATIEAGKFKLQLSLAGVNERITNVVDLLSRWAKTKNISIQSEAFSEEMRLIMDKDKIEQVLTNLISNAVKFTPEGGQIFVSAARKKPTEQLPQGAVEFSIKDTGPGISTEDIEKIFNKFERASAISTGIEGTGLGLSICKEIVSLHGGKIWVESKLNQGSKFSFFIPG
ncbi:MAG: ATP-binding protein, partial [Candidatus Omnitrophota bacterium]